MVSLSDLASYPICRRCAGRIFAMVGTGLTNLERGSMLEFSIKCEKNDPEFNFADPQNCEICHGIFDKFSVFLSLVEDKLKEIEYSTFVVGSVFPKEWIELENKIQEAFGAHGESIKKEFNREFGKYITAKTGKEYRKEDPDITIAVNVEYEFVNVSIKSLFIYGKYRKYRRDMPQTRWIHKKDGDSIESIIGEAALRIAGGKNYYLHGSGREDVDVRMLGNGREFVIEVEAPIMRTFDLSILSETVNRSMKGVEIFDLSFVDRKTVKEIKEEKHSKVYDCIIEGDTDIDKLKLEEACTEMNGKNIYQRTPLRVAQRRSDLIRTRKIERMELVAVEGKEAEIVVQAEAGTYIKELISGDSGRTNPSLSSKYGSQLNVKELDVIKICRGE